MKPVCAQFIVTWPDPFAASGGDSTLQEILVDLRRLGDLDVATVNPFRVTSTSEMVLRVYGQPAFKERVQKLPEEERKVEVVDI